MSQALEWVRSLSDAELILFLLVVAWLFSGSNGKRGTP